ncbi:MAG: hypothetical protein V1858_04925 [Candidatus Gottesmanbacteria bacterium]
MSHERVRDIINQFAKGHEICFIEGAGGVEAWNTAWKFSEIGDRVGTAVYIKASKYPGVDHGISGDYKAAMMMGAFEEKAKLELKAGNRRKAQRLSRRAHKIGRMDY